MNITSYFDSEIAEHAEILFKTREQTREKFSELVSACTSAIRAGNKLLFFGNGGSASDAQHIATEFVVRFRANRRAIAAIALTADTTTLTAIGNDFGFENIFARQIEALGLRGDVAIGISTSGNSANVIRGLQAARNCGATTAAFGGGDGGQMKNHTDHLILVSSSVTARIQEMHILIGHILCATVERELGLL
jgi:D-sedoheptulose 7-phosphate isomerase